MNKLRELKEIMFVDFPDCVNVNQLQEMLKIKRTKAYELLNNGKIKYIKLGKKIVIPKINIIAYMFGEEQV